MAQAVVHGRQGGRDGGHRESVQSCPGRRSENPRGRILEALDVETSGLARLVGVGHRDVPVAVPVSAGWSPGPWGGNSAPFRVLECPLPLFASKATNFFGANVRQ